MLWSLPARLSSAVAAIFLVCACSAQTGTLAPGTAGALSSSTQRAPEPEATSDSVVWARVGAGTPKQSKIVRGATKLILNQTFANASTSPKSWPWADLACLTAGTKSTPASSVPACGSSAPQDAGGKGALQLTTPAYDAQGFTVWTKAVPTANGLDIQFTLYAFNGNTNPGADGTLLFLTDAGKARPTGPSGNGYCGGCLGYIPQQPTGGPIQGGLANAYLGIGFDEFGNFSRFLPGGPGFIPETIAVGGSTATNYSYLAGVTNEAGQHVSLPFDLDSPTSQSRQAHAPTIDVSLTATGLLEVAVDIHNGQGYVTYVSQNVVGIHGQPAVPKNVFLGVSATTGYNNNRHQINDLRVTTLN